MSRSTLTGVGVAALFAVALGVQVLRAVGADGQSAETVVSIAKQEKAIAEVALKVLTDSGDHGQLEVSRWSRRLVEATRKSGASKAEINAAIKQHVARTNRRLKIVQRLHEAAAVTLDDLLNAQYEALEAQSLAVESQN